MKPCSSFPFGSNEASFGHNGAGGSFGFTDPNTQLGYAYVPNRMEFHFFNDPREKALRDACHCCLRELGVDRGETACN